MHPVGLAFITPSYATAIRRPLLAVRVSAGFPSPADDYLESRIDFEVWGRVTGSVREF